MDEAKFAKLPKWARDHIDLLGRRIKEIEQDLATFNGEVSTNTFARYRFTGDASKDLHPLPKDSESVFILGEGNRFEQHEFSVSVGRDEKYRGKYIRVSGMKAIAIRPQAANVVEVCYEETSK